MTRNQSGLLPTAYLDLYKIERVIKWTAILFNRSIDPYSTLIHLVQLVSWLTDDV